MNNPLALCELAARAPNISAGHKVKQAWLPNDRFFILDFPFHSMFDVQRSMLDVHLEKSG